MTWIQNKKTQLSTIKQIERTLMSRPDIRAALNRYIASANLQGQINRGAITEQQAAQLFRKAIHDFSYKLNENINQRFTPPFINENDLSNPSNMERELRNPISPASIQFNDTATSTVLAINDEADSNEQAQNQEQMIINQQITEDEDDTQTQAPAPAPQSASHEKEALLVTAVLGVSLGKDEIENVFEKYIGNDLKNELGNELDKIESPFKIPTFKPEPPKTDD